MGADIKSLRTRIKSVDATLHLTKAMGLVASSKMRRAIEGMRKGRAYEAAVRDVVKALIASPECLKSPYVTKREEGKTCLFVIAGDRGLAGGYNANVFRLLKSYPDAEVVPIGRRACDRFGGDVCLAEGFSYAVAKGLSYDVLRAFTSGVYKRVGIICTKYLSMLSQEAGVRFILPLEGEESGAVGTVYEPDEETVLNEVIPEYVAGLLVSAVRESFCCEVAARRTAMDSAGKNAQQMIDSLKLTYNRARQGAITQEIIEIVAGSGI